VSAWGVVSATATFYSATCIVHCSSINCRTASMPCRACHQQTFIQPALLMSTGLRVCDRQTSTATKVVDAPRIPPFSAPSWTRTTVANGQKFSAVWRLSRRLLDRSKNAIFTYPICWGDDRNFVKIFLHHKNRVPGLSRGGVLTSCV